MTSHQLGRVVSAILFRYFGEIVQKVGDDLFTYGKKPISFIQKTSGLPKSQIVNSLRTLLKFDLATFEPSVNEVVADYKLIPDNVLLLIRYPRYLLQIKSKFGSEAETIVEELLQQATCTSTVLIISIASKYKEAKEKNMIVIKLKDTLISLVTAGYIQQAPVVELKDGCEIPTLVPVATIVPELDTRVLMQALSSGNLSEHNDNVYWRINYDRFHQDFRDDIMIKAISRTIDDNAGELLRLLLEQMYLTSPAWAPESNATSALTLRDSCRRVATEWPLLHQYQDQYIKLLEENGCGFVRRCGDEGGGQLKVRCKKAAEQLVHAVLDHTVTERLGSKAARIFRLIRSRKYIDENDIQKDAMLVNKECKQLTYNLLEEHFISLHPMRKGASSGAMAKAVQLYHISLYDVSHKVQEMCYRALHNTMRRGEHERETHARLLDKQRRVRSIVHGMRLRGEPQKNIDDVEETLTPPELAVLQSIEKKLKQLSTAELELDKNLFIFKWYFMYCR